MKKLVWWGSLVLLLTLSLLVGCQNKNSAESDGGSTKNEATENSENVLDGPVTITIYNQTMGLIDDDLVTELFKPVTDKYPDVSFELLKDVNLEDMVAAGEVPDIITTSNPMLYDLIDMELAGDMSKFLDRQNFDWGRINPAIIDDLKQQSETFDTPDAIYGMPISLNYGLLVYNKEIFDLFGVDYPEAGLTWDEVIDLARQVTGTRDGVDYIGFDPGWIHEALRAHSLSYIDDNGEVDLTTDGFKEVLSVFDQAYNIPGMIGENEENYGYGGITKFIEERRLAMFPYWVIPLTSRIPVMEETGVEWDITTFPAFSSTPDLGRNVDYHAFVIPETAKNREAALQIAVEMMSDEAQTYLSEQVNRVTVLDNEDIRESYAAGSDMYEGKHLQEIFSIDPSPDRKPSPYNSELDEMMKEVRKKLALENKDVNTVLREAQEEANKVVKDIQATQ
ncbi:extracellular solute-binding protein [Lederbergia sp. NSJ-179]|uniref:ABC transporter substrate-binding protein n=1 Tax=Lederbergia sp. NSJ-179 TaxID=2931402 RepID=UPI001FD217F5|nr:extracellular solute-binding protein [Lederbergia sp. NSJ-179]MCJ7843018.1 extracellular solute-binding protein [Lederbergia sp. NSJ-179]